jgi:vacuolar-type H+-ATPase subunit I/STV1
LSNLTYLNLIKNFGSQDAITQLIGFKVKNHTVEAQDQETATNNLFNLIAILLKHEIIELSEIWSYLGTEADPEEDSIQKLLKKQKKLLEYQYGMMDKTITNRETFAKEEKSKTNEQKEINEERQKLSSDCRLRLLKSCVEMNDWQTVDTIMNCLYDGQLDLTLSKATIYAMINALSW